MHFIIYKDNAISDGFLMLLSPPLQTESSKLIKKFAHMVYEVNCVDIEQNPRLVNL